MVPYSGCDELINVPQYLDCLLEFDFLNNELFFFRSL